MSLHIYVYLCEAGYLCVPVYFCVFLSISSRGCVSMCVTCPFFVCVFWGCVSVCM